MMYSYLKTALRYLFKHKLQAVLNITGLAVGLACCLILAVYVVQELSYDAHYANASRIYRIGRVLDDGQVSEGNSVLAAALLEQEFPGIARAVGLATRTVSPALLARENLAFFEDRVNYADPGFFELFDFQWLEGDAERALGEPGSVVLTETLAAKYFGSDAALGETLLLDNRHSLQITGVIADLPPTTHLSAEAFISMDVFRQQYAERGFDIEAWNFAAVSTYALLEPGVDITSVASGFPAFVARHVPAGSTRITGLAAMPLTDIHLTTDNGATLNPVARIFIFGSIALCILLIAGINFVNLATAHSSWRQLEVGLRKSMGASRKQLVLQFLAETCLLILLASLLAAGLAELLLPNINAALGLKLSLAVLAQPAALTGLCLVLAALALLAGSYPAFYLSSVKPSLAIRDKAGGVAGLHFRNVLVVLQFTIAIVLLVTSAVVFLQMRLASSAELGYDSNEIVEFALPEAFDVNMQWTAFTAGVLQAPGVISATHSLSSPLLPSRLELELAREGEDAGTELVTMMSDSEFFATYRIPLVAGRLFSADVVSDRIQRFDPAAPDTTLGNVILNETAVKQLGWLPEQAIGEFVHRDNGARYAVIGVVGDTAPSVKEGPVGMMFMMPASYDYRAFGGATGALRISGVNLAETLAHIELVWREFAPNEPMRLRFLNDQILALYQGERMQGRLFSYSALFAVLIACSGLLGLAAFSARRRFKEIGVRKVMGGSAWSIVLLLTNDFSRLVLISNLIAWPVAYFAMQRWLENFAYRIDLTPLVFIGSGLIALCIAWVTVGGTAAKAASAKPVLALRYE